MTSVLLVLLLSAVAPVQEPKTSAQEILQMLPLLQQNQQRELERVTRQLAELQARRLYERQGGAPLATSNAWWTNTGLVERLALTDDQKVRIERAYENHRLKLASSAELLEKEERQLSMLLNAEPINRNAILTQIDRVVQARGEMERSNSAMTLEMREVLTRAQWTQLQSQPQWTTGISFIRRQPVTGERSGGGRGGPGTVTPTVPGTGTRGGGRGQRQPQQ